jgi:chromosome segregation ATPase
VLQSDLESERAAHQRTRTQWDHEHEARCQAQTQLSELKLQHEMSTRRCHDQEQEIKRLSDILNNVQKEWSLRVQHLEKELSLLRETHRRQQQQSPQLSTSSSPASSSVVSPQRSCQVEVQHKVITTTPHHERENRIQTRDKYTPTLLSSASSSFVPVEQSSDESLLKLNNASASLPLNPVTLEKLRLALQQRDGEIELLNAKIESLEHAKRIIENELLLLTKQNEELQMSNAELRRQQEKTKELESRYLAALELLGERSEKVVEVTQDLHDWRMLYKQQINTLCLQIEELRKKNDILTVHLQTLQGSTTTATSSSSSSPISFSVSPTQVNLHSSLTPSTSHILSSQSQSQSPLKEKR